MTGRSGPQLRSVILLLTGIFSANTVCHAEIRYQVTPNVAAKTLRVEMSVPPSGSEILVQIPRWEPGAYFLSSGAPHDIKAETAEGSPLQVDPIDKFTWRISIPMENRFQPCRVRYDLPTNVADNSVHFSGPSTYLYVVDRKQEPCRLKLSLPKDWKIAIGTNPTKESDSEFVFPSYDVLADNPVTMGKFKAVTYTALGKPHMLALRGEAVSDTDLKRLISMCRFVSESEGSFFGNLPYDRYVWHFSMRDGVDGGGGLEHLSSTEIGLSSGLGPKSIGLLAHEFFHLWNVKRIRSRPLGPFDYTQLPQTGALWWLEGVTDYYADMIPRRFGWSGDAHLQHQTLMNYTRQSANPERLKVSPYDSSFRVRETNHGLGNSNGYGVSYYETGWLVGLCLDIEILAQTHGKHSLDDVEHALWTMCKDNQPGFAEDEIRTQCIKFGGESLGPFYDSVVMKPGELPVESQLAKLGMQIKPESTTEPDWGFQFTARANEKGLVVGKVERNDEFADLKSGDVIKSINGETVEFNTVRQISQAYNRIFSTLKPNSAVSITVKRSDSPMVNTVNGRVGARAVNKKMIVIHDELPESKSLRTKWLAQVR